MSIDRERLAAVFTELCEIESPSRNELRLSEHLQHLFGNLGADEIIVDDSAYTTGSDTGNLIIRFHGSNGHDPLFFCCHMDTVGPTDGISVVRNGDIFSSRGDTILGADDKSGIASLVEMMHTLRQGSIAHCPIELVFTTCEEIGLLGAKALKPELITARYGYALDSTSKDKVIIGAPTANRLKITLNGKAAHSGSAPEKGINALAIAADAITRIKLGRIDSISTANFGLIKGGTATNIIPQKVVLEGEVRSHSKELLSQYTEHIVKVFTKVTENWPVDESEVKPTIAFDIYEDFPLMKLEQDEPVLERIRAASMRLGTVPVFDIAGGGSDANIFCGYGLKTAILPTGMAMVHTTDEQVELEDMVRLTELLVAMVS